ncbi:PD-(D/E)XK motif protein [Saccharicrinis sp. FJH62]|uniref:PD-(D/E)XK motif protein n=1 Tax=Saccharicrinis sp. FJH62 TaxID=3344657 RepID=UPI0035D51C9C
MKQTKKKMKNNQLNTIWFNEDASSENIYYKRISSIANLSCYAGKITYTDTKFFTLRLNGYTKLSDRYIKRFSGVEIQYMPLTSEEVELVVLLSENDLLDIFTLFIEDLIASLMSICEVEEALTVISLRISYWRTLFGKIIGGLLTSQQQQGLYGELLILEFLLKETDNNAKIIESWQAPAGTNQDFYFGKTAIEVKTSKSNHPSIKISNEFQLDFSMFDNLFVAFIRLAEQQGGTDTLLQKINDIREILQLQPLLVDDFNLKLSYLGVTPDLESDYDKTSYKIRCVKYFQVTDDFPKIIPSMVNTAVTHISYEIAPNECSEFEVSSEDVLKKL